MSNTEEMKNAIDTLCKAISFDKRGVAHIDGFEEATKKALGATYCKNHRSELVKLEFALIDIKRAKNKDLAERVKNI